MSALRVALMGYGAVADIHARSIIGCPEVEVVAVIGPRPGRAREFAERHGIPGVFDGLTEAHRAVHPDAVIITTPTGLHPRHARDAVNAGLHALVEFPLAAEPETTRKLFGEAEVRGLTLAVAHTSRFIWSFRRARSLLNEGAMGEVKAANFVRLMDRPPGTGAAGMSRTWTDDALVHHAGHVLDIYRFWFGDSVGLVGSVSPEGEQGRRNAGLLLEGPGSCPLACLMSYDARGSQLSVRLITAKGDIEIDGFARLLVNGREDATEDRPTDNDTAYREAIREQDRFFVEAAQSKRNFPVSAEEMTAVNELIWHSRLSGRS